MCKPNNHHDHQHHRGASAAAGQRQYSLPLPAILAALLWQSFPAVSLASLETTPDVPPATVQAAPRPLSAAKTAGGYQVRCWQHGRLLFEENNVTLPADGSRYALKLSGSDGNGRPLYVAETQNATCLVRHAPSAVANPGLPR